jgi:hypothetical protein
MLKNNSMLSPCSLVVNATFEASTEDGCYQDHYACGTKNASIIDRDSAPPCHDCNPALPYYIRQARYGTAEGGDYFLMEEPPYNIIDVTKLDK